MKGRYLLFAVCLGCLVFQGGRADDADTARAAARRIASNATSTTQSRQKSTSSDTATMRTSAGASRGSATTPAKAATNNQRTTGARTATISDDARQNTDVATPRSNVVMRPGQITTVQGRPVATTARTATATTAHGMLPTRIVTSTARPQSTMRSATASPRTRSAAETTVSRAATNDELRDTIMERNYTTCRTIYYECMDEFCANKDAQLKRCACSSRLHEFDKVKKRLANVEDKLLDFNQRLLTVNMDKEDAEALFTATEGELAYNTKDTSASKKMLDEIAKKLNSNSDSSFNQGLSAISLSLNTEAAFDNVDSLMGASTTSKEGTELHNAALPVCREMAAEVCTEQDLALAQSGYQMMIEQDCNTVAKAYETRTDQAREKIREGGALLDISRLDIYQKRNADDILTCKTKMLEQLSDTTVCGENLSKCLDMSGQYIDPSTGQAFLTENLVELSTLIKRPTKGQTWTTAPGNNKFVSFLNSKKKYLEPAMDSCQDIADYVWDEFIEDALAQIKLAQDNKLEEVRQSCTTLTTQCLSDASTSIANFDARALSTFGILADKTANEMCAKVKTACSALLKATDWDTGISNIATAKTYDTILQTCREVGRACIIQTCKSISGNFGLCTNSSFSNSRDSILNRTVCWDEVKECVEEAGKDTIKAIFTTIETNTDNFYAELYKDIDNRTIINNDTTVCVDTKKTEGNNTVETKEICLYDICTNDCSHNDNESNELYECHVCRLVEKIWGNCEASPTAVLTNKVENTEYNVHNNILVPKGDPLATLLSWFGKNTESYSCTTTQK